MSNFNTIVLGQGIEKPITITVAERNLHVLIIGKSGCGKSTMLSSMAQHDIENNRGVAVIDPHGDFSDDLLNRIPRRRIKDVVFFDPSDLAHCMGLNLLSDAPVDARPFIASSIVATLSHIFGLSQEATPRLLHYLRNVILALMDTEGTTLSGVPLMLTNEEYRTKILKNITNPATAQFWFNEYKTNSDRYNAEAAAPVVGRVMSLLSYPAVRNIVGQPKSTVDFRWLMDHNKIFIANLSKGKIGDEVSNLLGSTLITHMHLAALSRADIPENEREPFHLIVDEIGSFSTKAFASALSEARKYGLSVSAAAQYYSQMSAEVRDAFVGNVGTLIAFRVGVEDAKALLPNFHPMQLDAMTDMPMHSAWVRRPTAVDRVVVETVRPTAPVHNHGANIMRHSRDRFTRPRERVEPRIDKFFRRYS